MLYSGLVRELVAGGDADQGLGITMGRNPAYDMWGESLWYVCACILFRVIVYEFVVVDGFAYKDIGNMFT